MRLSAADSKKLLPQLDRLCEAVEDLMLGGLTTASEATRQSLAVAFQETSRLRLLRLGNAIRAANEELGRYTRDDANFSQRRLVFFLNRAWLLAKGVGRAIREKPGTGKSWLSEHLAAAISGVSTLTIQGTAGTTEEHIKYSWNIARVIAEGPTPRSSRSTPWWWPSAAAPRTRIGESSTTR